MKNIIEYKNADGPCKVGDVVYLGPNLTEKAELLTIRKAKYGDVYVFRCMSEESIYGTDSHGFTPFCGIPYIYAKEIEAEEEQQ